MVHEVKLDPVKVRLFHDLYEQDKTLEEVRCLMNLEDENQIYDYLLEYQTETYNWR